MQAGTIWVSESSRPSWGQEGGQQGLGAGLELVEGIPRLPTGSYSGWAVPRLAIPKRGRGSGCTGSPEG